MSIENYRDPLIIQWWTDSQGNKITIQRTNESYKVINNKITLTEIPSEFDKVQITGYTELRYGNSPASSTEFVVNYTLGEITFYSTEEAKTIVINSYYSRGCIYYPSSRIYNNVDNSGNITQTLGDLLAFAKISYQTPVSTYSSIVTTYPNPSVGYAVQCEDTGRFYRWDGTTWQYFQILNPTQLSQVLTDMGDKNNLTTTDKSSLVNAINENSNEIGILSTLTTTDKSNLVNATNEVNNNMYVLNNAFVSHLADSAINIKSFGAHSIDEVGYENFDNANIIETALNSNVVAKRVFYFPGKFKISRKIEYVTDDILTSNYTKNGVILLGDTNSGFIATSDFTLNGTMLSLNGNPTASEDTAQPRAQIGNIVYGINFDGNNRAARGIQFRANINPLFDEFTISNMAGGMTDAAIYVDGVTTSGKDDADSSIGAMFRRISVLNCAGHGILATNNRVGNFEFVQCNFRFCNGDGIRAAFAGLTIINCLFDSNGNVGDNTTGGFTAIKSATGAKNRGLSIQGGLFEASYWHEINVKYCYGVSISGIAFHPYQRSDISSTPTQELIKLGGEAAEGVVITGCRVQEYTLTYAYNIIGVHCYAGAKNVSIKGISFPDIIAWGEQYRYIKDTASSQIEIDNSISAFCARPTIGTAIADVTGTGTEYSMGTLWSLAGMVAEYDIANELGSTGAFTCKTAGLYEFNIETVLTGFTANHTGVELYINKNSNSVVTQYLTCKMKPYTTVSADKYKYSGQVKLKLLKGDVVYVGIRVVGVTDKTIDICRETINDIVWAGNKI